MLRRVHLHGYFSKFHDGPVMIAGDTVAELVEGVTRQLEGFQPDPIKGRHRVKVAGFDTEEAIFSDLGPEVEDIHLVPQFNGGKNGGLLQILVGAALIGLSFIPGIGALASGLLMKVGALALLGGLTQMLAPTPDSDSQTQNRSNYLGTPKNTVKIGTRIPILYGRHRVYGHYLSFDINAIEYNP